MTLFALLGGVLAMWVLMAAVAALAWGVCRASERREPAELVHDYPRTGDREAER